MPEQSSLYIYNTLNGRKELFVPRTQGTVKLFTCGPSVYREQHIGNYRTFLFEDILQRYLEYQGFDVERGMNFTDIEDKAVEESRSTGRTLSELTQPVIDSFFESAKLLELSLPKPGIPRATEVVQEAVSLVQRLLDRGHAYRHTDGNIYYDPLSYPGFGEVFGLDMSNWPEKRVRFAKDTYEGRRWNRGDFVLWHGDLPDDGFSWDTELGRGRPAWNVQDPAIILSSLGSEIDIHCGGIDNVYRHHDYNRAVMEGAFGTEFCPYWVHGEHLIVDGKKMSKSRGNVMYPSQLLKRGYSPQTLRLGLTYCYYREQLNLTEEHLQNTAQLLSRLQKSVDALIQPRAVTNRTTAHRPEWEVQRTDRMIEEIPGVFRVNMDNDLGVKSAVDDLTRLLEHLDRRAAVSGLSTSQCARVRSHVRELNEVLRVLRIE